MRFGSLGRLVTSLLGGMRGVGVEILAVASILAFATIVAIIVLSVF